MRYFKNLSIRSKLLFTVISIVTVALLIASSGIAFVNHKTATAEFKKQLKVLVEITAERSKAAVAFKDRSATRSNLATLSKMESIDTACLYDRTMQIFEQYIREGSNKTCSKKWTIKDARNNEIDYQESTVVGQNLTMNNLNIGYLVVDANTAQLDKRLKEFFTYIFIMILFSLFVAFAITTRMQRALTLPLINLSKTSKKIENTHDFSLRAEVHSHDETGQLADAFNNLIGTIQDSQIQMQELVIELQEKTKQLESHSELVEDRNKVIRNMFAGASHDLRQPLQAMSLFVQALQQAPEDQKDSLVFKLDLSINSMRKAFDELLDVSRLESHLDQVQRGAVELKPLLDGVFNEFDALARDKKLQLRFHSKDYVVDSNARMLERIIRNLLSNAIRYTSSGGVLLACRRRQNHILIEVWDTGCGIPEENFEQIFKRFYQLEDSSAEGKQGYGLGLSIVKRLSVMLKHPIEVKSTPGKGTLFRVKVPLGDSEGSPESQKSDLPANDIVSLPGTEARILLIDDDQLVRDALAPILNSWGMTVTDFDSVTQMKTYLAAHPNLEIDVIVSDFQLSASETGLDAIREARCFLGEDTPALIITGTKEPELLQIIEDSGIRKLSKPLKAAKLRALINHLILK